MMVQEFWDINKGWPAFSNVTQKIVPDQLSDIKQAMKKGNCRWNGRALCVGSRQFY
tara:strand:+ start:1582 stop:1749 length:168 start_codon:yes stop_codon:yes gene_type:complete